MNYFDLLFLSTLLTEFSLGVMFICDFMSSFGSQSRVTPEVISALSLSVCCPLLFYFEIFLEI